jgi:hypothetical protein
MTKNNFFWYSFLLILLCCFAVYAVNRFVLIRQWPDLAKVPNIAMYAIYLFNFLITVGSVFIIHRRYLKDQTAAGRTFFLTVFVKIITSAIFLFPGVIVVKAIAKVYVIEFMTLFFILLFVETYLLIRLLNLPSDEKIKNDQNQ